MASKLELLTKFLDTTMGEIAIEFTTKCIKMHEVKVASSGIHAYSDILFDPPKNWRTQFILGTH